MWFGILTETSLIETLSLSLCVCVCLFVGLLSWYSFSDSECICAKRCW